VELEDDLKKRLEKIGNQYGDKIQNFVNLFKGIY
jgi:hypothetical protein